MDNKNTAAPGEVRLRRLVELTEKVNRLIGTSGSDCEITVMHMAAQDPAGTLDIVKAGLVCMNDRKLDKKSHRRALQKAGRLALNLLGDNQ